MHTPRSYVQRERDRFKEERKVADEVCVEVEGGVGSGETENRRGRSNQCKREADNTINQGGLNRKAPSN